MLHAENDGKSSSNLGSPPAIRVIYRKSGPSKDEDQYTTEREQAYNSGLSKASGPPLETAIQTEDNKRRLLVHPRTVPGIRFFHGACRRKGLGQGPMAHICGYSACRGRRASWTQKNKDRHRLFPDFRICQKRTKIVFCSNPRKESRF